jgi:hypothetical protein
MEKRMSEKRMKAEISAELEEVKARLKEREDELQDLREEIVHLKSKISKRKKFISIEDLPAQPKVSGPRGSGGMILIGEDGNPKIIEGRKK